MEKKYVIYKLFSQKSAPLITIKTEQKSNSFPSSPLETVEYTWEAPCRSYVMPPPSIPVRLCVLYPALVSQLVSMLLCSAVFVEVAIIPCRVVTLVASVPSSRFTDASMLHTCQVCCPVKLTVSLEWALFTIVSFSLLVHAPKYQRPFKQLLVLSNNA